MTERPDLPLTVVGGFLGAGKTTLLNHLLGSAGRRWGVLVNDFGAIGVDAALIAAQQGGLVELANGCLCCSLGEDLGFALERLARHDPPPEHVVVEASGIADPWRIAELALIEPGFTLAPLVVVADAAALPGQLADPAIGPTLRHQFAFADVVVLAKADLAADLPAVSAQVRALRPQARILPARMGAIDPAALEFAPPARPAPARLRAEPAHPFVQFVWPCPTPLDPLRLRAALALLPASVLRVKGFFRLAPEGAPHLLQDAAERWAVTPHHAAAACALVVIGTADMDPGAVRALFEGTP